VNKKLTLEDNWDMKLLQEAIDETKEHQLICQLEFCGCQMATFIGKIKAHLKEKSPHE